MNDPMQAILAAQAALDRTVHLADAYPRASNVPEDWFPPAPRKNQRPAPHPTEQVSNVSESDPRRRTWWSAADLMATEFPEPRWAVRDMLADGLTLFAGSPKVGKSWLALSVGIAVAAGGKVLSAFDAEQGEVLYLALEDQPRRLKDRLAKLLQGDYAPAALTIATEWSNEGLADWLGRKNKRLLVIDVLARVRSATMPGVPQYEADYATMRKIKGLADEHELAVVAVHHTRKMGAADFLDMVSGTNGLMGGADGVMVLKRTRGGDMAELHVTGRDVAEQEHALKFDADFGIWTKLDGRPADYNLSDTRQHILSYLHEQGSATPKQVADALELNHNTVKVTLRRMAESGQVADGGKGLYMPVTPVTLSPDDESDEEEELQVTAVTPLPEPPEEHNHDWCHVCQRRECQTGEPVVGDSPNGRGSHVECIRAAEDLARTDRNTFLREAGITEPTTMEELDTAWRALLHLNFGFDREAPVEAQVAAHIRRHAACLISREFHDRFEAEHKALVEVESESVRSWTRTAPGRGKPGVGRPITTVFYNKHGWRNALNQTNPLGFQICNDIFDNNGPDRCTNPVVFKIETRRSNAIYSHYWCDEHFVEDARSLVPPGIGRTT